MGNKHSFIKDYIDTGKGKPIILISGMEGRKEFWRYQIEGLKIKYRVISCSYPDFDNQLSKTIFDYAKEFINLLDSLDIDNTAIIGLSMGGLIAQEIALTITDRIKALILCNTLDKPRILGFGLNIYTFATFVHHIAFVAPKPLQKPILNWVGRNRGFVMDPSPGNDNFADYILEYGLSPGFGGYLARIISGSKPRDLKLLSKITMPTLILRGTEDRVVPPEAIVELVGRIPKAELALIDGGGHCCPHTMPETTNKVLLNWLEKYYNPN